MLPGFAAKTGFQSLKSLQMLPRQLSLCWPSVRGVNPLLIADLQFKVLHVVLAFSTGVISCQIGIASDKI